MMAEDRKTSVYQYDDLEQRTARRPAVSTPYEQEICRHMETVFPQRTTRVYREMDSEFLHADVFVMQAPTKQDFHVLYTIGMSALPMQLPAELLPQYKDLERAELMLLLPAEWDILTGYEVDTDVPSRLWWPVRLMKYLARFPHEYQTWLGWGHTVPNSEAFVPYDESTRLCGAMLGALQERISVFRTEADNTQINFYTVMPLYQEEMAYQREMGTEALMQKLAELKGFGMIVFPDRPNVCTQKQKNEG